MQIIAGCNRMTVVKTDLDLYLYALGQIILIILFCWSSCKIIVWLLYRIWKYDSWIDASKPPKHGGMILLFCEAFGLEWIEVGYYDGRSFFVRETRHSSIKSENVVKWRELPYPKERKK